MAKNIPLSPKYGVNAAIPKCFFCGGDKDELALMGRLKGDIEAPKNLMLDYEPCEKCKAAFSQGILMLGVAPSMPDSRPPIAEGLYPTGAYVVATEEFVRQIVPEEEAKRAIKAGQCLIDHNVLVYLQKEHEKACKESEG